MLPDLRLLFTDTQAALGRLDYDSLNDQSRMEILIEGLDEDSKAYFQDKNGAFHDICEWEIVSCDDKENVIDIDFHCDTANGDGGSLAGTLNLNFLPPKLIKVAISKEYDIAGTLDTKSLPRGLELFALEWCEFDGTVDLTALPNSLQSCSLESCRFSGSCVLTDLPENLHALDVNSNLMSGTLDLTKLPKSLSFINLSFNQFTGTLNLLHLPSGINSVYFEGNNLSGVLDLRVVPASLTAVRANTNAFSGLAIVSSSYTGKLSLGETGITGIVDEGGARHERERIEVLFKSW